MSLSLSKRHILRLSTILGVMAATTGIVVGCDDSTSTSSSGGPNTPGLDGSTGSDTGTTVDSGAPQQDSGTTADTGSPDTGADAGKTLAPGLLDPIPYLSKADNPLVGVNYTSYLHFEDWEQGSLKAPGVTPGPGYVVATPSNPLTDSVDGDDGVVDGKCQKIDGGCNSAFGNGTIDFTFDAAVLGGLPTHVGIAWTDGSTGCEASFEAFDANDVSLGIKTVTGIGDASNSGTVAEDRFFGIVAMGGVKKIVVKSSIGGVEVDHLTFGR